MKEMKRNERKIKGKQWKKKRKVKGNKGIIKESRDQVFFSAQTRFFFQLRALVQY